MALVGRKVSSLKRRVRSHLAKIYKTLQLRSTFRSCDVEKVHAIVAQNRFPSQNVQNTTCSELFSKLCCVKSARRWGAKRISKSKVSKNHCLRPLFDVQMSFLRGRHRGLRALFKVSNTLGFGAISIRTTTTLYCTPLHDTTLHSTPLNYTTLNRTTVQLQNYNNNNNNNNNYYYYYYHNYSNYNCNYTSLHQ